MESQPNGMEELQLQVAKRKEKFKGPPLLASALWTPLSSLEGQHRTP